MYRQTVSRYVIYISGMMILALGIILNTKTDLGVSPLISMPFSVSEIWHLNFASLAFIMYASFTVIEILLEGKDYKKSDWLQIPFSVVFSLLLQVFGDGYDSLMALLGIETMPLWLRFIMLVIGVAMTGIGVAMTITMQLIPNPADGLAKAVGMRCRKNLGFGKNLIDTLSVIITCCIGLLVTGRIIGVGIGTVVAMIGVGRCMAAFNYFFKDKMLATSGLETAPTI